LNDNTWKNVDFIYNEPFIGTSSQKHQGENNGQSFIPRYYHNIQEVQKIDYSRIIGHFKKALNYSLEDKDQNNLDELILSYIAEKEAIRNTQTQLVYNKDNQALFSITLSDGCVYNVDDVENPIVCKGKGRPPNQ
ncbi:24711_t:CDS:1, partial [Gigaspora rosea]